MNAFQFGQLVGEKIAVGPAAAPGAGVDPMAAIRAQRVAQMKADAAKVRAASGTPAATGNGTHQWSGRVMPGGAVQGAQYSGPAAPAAKPAMPQHDILQGHPGARRPVAPAVPAAKPAMPQRNILSR